MTWTVIDRDGRTRTVDVRVRLPGAHQFAPLFIILGVMAGLVFGAAYYLQ